MTLHSARLASSLLTPLAALALAACGSEATPYSLGGSDGGGGRAGAGAGSTGGVDTAGGATSIGGSAAVGGASQTGGGPATGGAPGTGGGTAGPLTCDLAAPDNCTVCQGELCCNELTTCGADPDCACVAQCVGKSGLGGLSGCLGTCGLASAPSSFSPLQTCMSGQCPDPDECG